MYRILYVSESSYLLAISGYSKGTESELDARNSRVVLTPLMQFKYKNIFETSELDIANNQIYFLCNANPRFFSNEFEVIEV